MIEKAVLAAGIVGFMLGVLTGASKAEFTIQKELIAANHATFVAEGDNTKFVLKECK